MVTMPSETISEQLRQLDILAPVDPDLVSRWRGSPTLANLHGKVGGFLGNKKANANLLLITVKELLDKNFELEDSVILDKFIYSRPAADDIVDNLAERCDFVVTAIGD